MATQSERLYEAENAYHELMLGKAVVEFRDANGESMRYDRASAPRLLAYIERLKTQIAAVASGPMYFCG